MRRCFSLPISPQLSRCWPLGWSTGTATFCAVVQRPALARVDDASLTTVMGNVHRFGDQRMPGPGVLGIIGSAAACVIAALAGETLASAAAGTAVGAAARLVADLPARQRTDQPRHHRRRREAPDPRQRPRPPTRLGSRHRAPSRPARPGRRRAVHHPPRLTVGLASKSSALRPHHLHRPAQRRFYDDVLSTASYRECSTRRARPHRLNDKAPGQRPGLTSWWRGQCPGQDIGNGSVGTSETWWASMIGDVEGAPRHHRGRHRGSPPG